MPMLKKTYSITGTLDQYVKSRIATGEYATDSEYLRELIRRDQDENREIAYIRSKLIKAEQSGFIDQSKEDMLEEFKTEMRANGELSP